MELNDTRNKNPDEVRSGKIFPKLRTDDCEVKGFDKCSPMFSGLCCCYSSILLARYLNYD